MNQDILKGQWKQLKGRVREQWGKLTDDDLDQIQGQAEQLVGRLQERYGWARADAQRKVDDWLRERNSTAGALLHQDQSQGPNEPLNPSGEKKERVIS